jgi:hypothetical protein
MINFLLRKTFYDYWDNFYKLFCINFCLALLMALYIHLVYLQGYIYLGIPIIYLFNLLIGGASLMGLKISDYDLPGFKVFFQGIKSVWVDALFFTACIALQTSIANHIIPFYLKLGNKMIGLSLAILVLWISAIWWAATIYYYPLRFRLKLSVMKTARQSLLLLADNVILAVGILFTSFVLVMLSLATAMLLPGISFLLVYYHVATRTLLLKYNYLESHPKADKKSILWDRLLEDDMKIINRRSLKEIIFPWKE